MLSNELNMIAELLVEYVVSADVCGSCYGETLFQWDRCKD